MVDNLFCDDLPAANSGVKKWRVTSKFESMCNKFTFVAGDSDEFQNPPLLKPARRYMLIAGKGKGKVGTYEKDRYSLSSYCGDYHGTASLRRRSIQIA